MNMIRIPVNLDFLKGGKITNKDFFVEYVDIFSLYLLRV